MFDFSFYVIFPIFRIFYLFTLEFLTFKTKCPLLHCLRAAAYNMIPIYETIFWSLIENFLLYQPEPTMAWILCAPSLNTIAQMIQLQGNFSTWCCGLIIVLCQDIWCLLLGIFVKWRLNKFYPWASSFLGTYTQHMRTTLQHWRPVKGKINTMV